MRFTALLTTLALSASTCLAAVSLVHNNCDFDVWVTPVGRKIGETAKLVPGNYWTQEQFFDEIGTAIKITRTKGGIYEGKPVLTFAYTYYKNNKIYYDLSSHAGFDFWGKKLRLHGEEKKDVTEIVWNGEPKPNFTAVYVGETDLTLELCEKK